jgi:hypothetical protein
MAFTAGSGGTFDRQPLASLETSCERVIAVWTVETVCPAGAGKGDSVRTRPRRHVRELCEVARALSASGKRVGDKAGVSASERNIPAISRESREIPYFQIPISDPVPAGCC